MTWIDTLKISTRFTQKINTYTRISCQCNQHQVCLHMFQAHGINTWFGNTLFDTHGISIKFVYTCFTSMESEPGLLTGVSCSWKQEQVCLHVCMLMESSQGLFTRIACPWNQHQIRLHVFHAHWISTWFTIRVPHP